MLLNNPKVTILLATNNRAHLIGETLKSILDQSYENWECIIVDDYSSDNTEDIIGEYIKNDSRFSYYLKTGKYKKGLSGTRNYGLDLAQEKNAQFIQLFDDDDIMHPRKLELQMEPFKKDPTLDLTICCYRKFDKKEIIEFDLVKADDLSCNIRTKNLLRSFFINQIDLNSPGPLWKAKLLENYRFNEDLNYAEEKEFYLRVFLNEKINYKPIEKILFWYRKHDKSITSMNHEDLSFKEEALKLFRDEFLNEIVKQKKAPFFLLKSYVAHGVRLNNGDYIFKTTSYICKGYNFMNLKYLLLLLSIKARFVWRKKYWPDRG